MPKKPSNVIDIQILAEQLHRKARSKKQPNQNATWSVDHDAVMDDIRKVEDE